MSGHLIADVPPPERLTESTADRAIGHLRKESGK
jgi:hypothetical protein